VRPSISHDFDDERLAANARRFQSLTLRERMDLLCEFTDRRRPGYWRDRLSD
jgi:hypothetical protein